MYDIGRKYQRKRIHTEAFLSHSYLPLSGDGGFEPFGVLFGLLETIQQPGTTVTRTPGEPVECLTLLRDGNLEISVGEAAPQNLAGRGLARSIIGDADSVVYRNAGAEPARYLEILLGVTDPPEARVETARLPSERGSFLLPVASGQNHADALPLLLDSAVYWGRMLPGGNVIFETLLTRRVCLLVLSGTVRVEEHRLITRDYARIERESRIPLFAQRMSEVVLIDMP